MKTFFGNLKPVNTVTHGKATFDLPILYHHKTCLQCSAILIMDNAS